MARSQNKFTEMFLGLLSAETANIIPPEMTARTENRKKNPLNDISDWTNGHISKQFHRKISWVNLYNKIA